MLRWVGLLALLLFWASTAFAGPDQDSVQTKLRHVSTTQRLKLNDAIDFETATLKHSQDLVETGVARIPYGWMDFCGRRPEECQVSDLPAADIKLTLNTWRTLDRINRQVNEEIEPVSNLDHWGTLADHWDYPVDGKGDCKIYALYKRKLLIDAGFPRQALLMTIVWDLDGEGHTILTVKTDKGEFILDNLVNTIRAWDETGYAFVKRQSQENPNVWMSLAPPHDTMTHLAQSN
ncbi:transglutaminase-like cysteine peptidase [Methylovirgula sp. 4M-Z18]|uniref:transglutaminase-like cysteine peptidase n=1 Tax=Methylovirgula sp. 4M-Z18 TaxID=2293567 RepID=UPI000E2FF252|nr:transglutaminase-like cysteine peptidase [Methylovirgula sp. 4M-Z18]RFB78503.1 transglutaminase [Methylovirgula sp. 4M-Z18]